MKDFGKGPSRLATTATFVDWSCSDTGGLLSQKFPGRSRPGGGLGGGQAGRKPAPLYRRGGFACTLDHFAPFADAHSPQPGNVGRVSRLVRTDH